MGSKENGPSFLQSFQNVVLSLDAWFLDDEKPPHCTDDLDGGRSGSTHTSDDWPAVPSQIETVHGLELDTSVISTSSDDYSLDSEDDYTIGSDESDSSSEPPSVFRHLVDWENVKQPTSRPEAKLARNEPQKQRQRQRKHERTPRRVHDRKKARKQKRRRKKQKERALSPSRENPQKLARGRSKSRLAQPPAPELARGRPKSRHRNLSPTQIGEKVRSKSRTRAAANQGPYTEMLQRARSKSRSKHTRQVNEAPPQPETRTRGRSKSRARTPAKKRSPSRVRSKTPNQRTRAKSKGRQIATENVTKKPQTAGRAIRNKSGPKAIAKSKSMKTQMLPSKKVSERRQVTKARPKPGKGHHTKSKRTIKEKKSSIEYSLQGKSSDKSNSLNSDAKESFSSRFRFFRRKGAQPVPAASTTNKRTKQARKVRSERDLPDDDDSIHFPPPNFAGKEIALADQYHMRENHVTSMLTMPSIDGWGGNFPEARQPPDSPVGVKGDKYRR